MSESQTCSNCYYLNDYYKDIEDKPDYGSPQGECRRYPPVIRGVDDSLFPAVHKSVWCGEWKEIMK